MVVQTKFSHYGQRGSPFEQTELLVARGSRLTARHGVLGGPDCSSARFPRTLLLAPSSLGDDFALLDCAGLLGFAMEIQIWKSVAGRVQSRRGVSTSSPSCYCSFELRWSLRIKCRRCCIVLGVTIALMVYIFDISCFQQAY